MALRLVIQLGGERRTVPLAEGREVFLGRAADNEVQLDDAEVSSRHAVVRMRDGTAEVEDLKSTNGTYLDEVRLRRPIELAPGHPVRMGRHLIGVEKAAADEKGGRSWKGKSGELSSSRIKPPMIEGASDRKTLVAPAPPADAPSFRPFTDAQIQRREQYRTVRQKIHRELFARLDLKRLVMSGVKDEELTRRARKTIDEIIEGLGADIPRSVSKGQLASDVFDEAMGLGPLEPFLADPEITEVMVNGSDSVYYEKAGKLYLSESQFLDDQQLHGIIERIVAPIGRRIDESQPMVDARLKDGSRVNVIIPPLSLKGPCVTIRKFSKIPYTVDDLIRQFGSFTQDMADFFKVCVQIRRNVVISGGTGSGKTTLLNVLSGYLPTTERIVTIEDAAELRLNQHHVVSLESRSANIEGRGAITIRDLVRNALRMRPDRIVVGECRGGEALDMLQAMNTGHDGSLTTVHANAPRDALARMETMVLMAGMDLPVRAIREQIASAIHVIIQQDRFSDGTRKVTSVTEIVGMENDVITMQELFRYVQTGIDEKGRVLGYYTATGGVPTFMEELRVRGCRLNPAIFERVASKEASG
ncbi:MAG: Flp pilus assembly complex ATPase component TadA [Verrucomicrobiae bacterium]|nr:Flp pilus assembly complex ATPase component TadA [Verrucomicrobiae bacterium]